MDTISVTCEECNETIPSLFEMEAHTAVCPRRRNPEELPGSPMKRYRTDESSYKLSPVVAQPGPSRASSYNPDLLEAGPSHVPTNDFDHLNQPGPSSASSYDPFDPDLMEDDPSYVHTNYFDSSTSADPSGAFDLSTIDNLNPDVESGHPFYNAEEKRAMSDFDEFVAQLLQNPVPPESPYRMFLNSVAPFQEFLRLMKERKNIPLFIYQEVPVTDITQLMKIQNQRKKSTNPEEEPALICSKCRTSLDDPKKQFRSHLDRCTGKRICCEVCLKEFESHLRKHLHLFQTHPEVL